MLEQWIKENANMKDRGSVAVINDDVWILPPRCFSNMPGLKKVILPYNLRKIGAFSFAGCRSLEVIDIPRQVVLLWLLLLKGDQPSGQGGRDRFDGVCRN